MDPAVPFPAGENSSETIIGTSTFSLATLKHWSYTLYANDTLSNESSCWLVFEPYTPPLLLPNGTFINATSCYVPIKPIRAQGVTGLVFGILFAASIVFTLINLRKHGRSLLPREKRWSIVGRRWQWYWMLFVAVCGTISSMTCLDVDRDYVQSTALMLRSFFYTLMFPGTLAALWEATRHWTSWQERQVCDADPFALRPHDQRSKKEFYMPLVFYFFDWLVFFMTIPRPWSAIQKQRSASQTESIARPVATDARFKAGGILSACALLVICYCVRHSMYYYTQSAVQQPQLRSSILKRIPLKITLGIIVVALRTGYSTASAWKWSISPYHADVSIAFLYGLGYSPSLLLLILFNVYGFLEGNDDRVLILQRARRSQIVDDELGITRASRKPSGWSKSHSKAGASAEEMLREMTFRSSNASTVTMSSDLDNDDPSGQWGQQYRKDAKAQGVQGQESGASSASSTQAYSGSMLEAASSITASIRPKRESSAPGSNGSSSTGWQARPQVVRSMLNV